MPEFKGEDNWNYIVFDGFQGGLQTTVEPNKIPENASPDMQNIVFDGGNSFQPRYGTSAFGATSSDYGAINSMYNFKHSNGTEYMMRTYDTVVQYYNVVTSAWAHVQTGFTSDKDFGFATYAIDDKVFYGNATEASQEWNGTSARELSSVAVGNIFLAHEARLAVTGLSAAKNSLYYSKSGDPLDFTGTISATAGDGGVQRFGAEGDSIKSLKQWNNKILVGKPDTLWTFEFELDYSNLGETPIAKPLITSESVGPSTNDSTIGVDNIMSWVTETKKIKALSESTVEDVLSFQNISDAIEPTLNDLNFANASSIYFDRKMFIACRETTSDFNNIVLVYDMKYNAWTKFVGWNVGAWVVWNSELYYGDSLITATYKALTGRNDATYDIASEWLSKEIDFGFPQIKKVAYELYIEGYITSNTSIDIDLYKNGNTDDSIFYKELTGADDSVDTSSSVAFGERQYGELALGSSPATTTIGNKFRQKYEIPQDDFHSIQVKVSANGDGQIYRITHIGFYVRLEDERVFKVSAFN